MLGLDPKPPLAYDTVAARTIAIGISGRTGTGEDEILTEMAGAGRGAAGLAGARLLMRSRPGFAQLAEADQRAIVERVAADPAVAPLRKIQTSAAAPGSVRGAPQEQKGSGLDR